MNKELTEKFGKLNDAEKLSAIKESYTFQTLYREIKKELTETKEIKSNTEEKLFRNLVYYELSGLLSILNDGFKKQSEFEDYIVYAASYRKKLEELADLLDKSAKPFKDRPSLYAGLKNYAIHLREMIKENEGHDFL